VEREELLFVLAALEVVVSQGKKCLLVVLVLVAIAAVAAAAAAAFELPAGATCGLRTEWAEMGK